MTSPQTTGMTNLSVTVSPAGGLKFRAATGTGTTIFLEPGPALGGTGENPNPLEYYVAAIGGCAAIKTQIDLAALGTAPESVEVRVDCTRRTALPQILETIHLTFTLKGELDDRTVAGAIRDVMTLHCPVAVMAAASAKVTWKHRIVPR